MSKPLVELLQSKLDSTELLFIVDNSLSKTTVLEKLGYSANGRRIKTIEKFLIDNDIDTSHFSINGKVRHIVSSVCPVCNIAFNKNKGQESITCSYSCANTYFRSKDNNPNWQNGSTTYRKHGLHVYGAKCNRCNYDKNTAALIVHHIDRDRKNNDLSNLEVLCCNCHAIEHYTN